MNPEYYVWIEIEANTDTLTNPAAFRRQMEACARAGIGSVILSVKDTSGFALWVVTGYHAGCILRELPESARCTGNVRAISCRWLQENWQTEIYAGCPAGDVCIIANYPPGISIQTPAP